MHKYIFSIYIYSLTYLVRHSWRQFMNCGMSMFSIQTESMNVPDQDDAAVTEDVAELVGRVRDVPEQVHDGGGGDVQADQLPQDLEVTGRDNKADNIVSWPSRASVCLTNLESCLVYMHASHLGNRMESYPCPQSS